jgi:hypothetical protein
MKTEDSMAFHHPNRKRKGHFVSPFDKLTIQALASLEAIGTYNARLSDWLEALRIQLSFWAGTHTQTSSEALKEWADKHALDFQASTEADVLMIWNPRWTTGQRKADDSSGQPSLF